MRFAASNIALPAFDHLHLLPRLAEMGLAGLEVAPSRVWQDNWHGLQPHHVDTYRQSAEAAGLTIVGLHSLFFDQPRLGLFKPENRQETLSFLIHLSALCRDLGGRTLIYGGGRRRGDWGMAAAMAECRGVLETLLPVMESHGTCLCFEPLGPKDTDFLNTAKECLSLVKEIGHPALAVQLDAKALIENDEADAGTFQAVADHLAHYHANDPGLAVVGSSGIVDHQRLGGFLRSIGYAGWVSIEQRQFVDADPLADLGASVAHLKACYGGPSS